ncbi:MAG: ATPase [Salinirussus sp.]
MKLLVAGARRVDAGKTTFAAGLVAATGAVGFKPRAGNDFWFDHGDCLTALQDGRLYGKDARRLAAASPGSLAPEDINPIHRLWIPSPGPDTGLLGQQDREFLVDRVGDEYVVNAGMDLPDAVRTAIDTENAIAVDSVDALNAQTEQRYLPLQRELLGEIRATDRAVIESYGDVATPLSVEPDAVAIIEPCQARLFDGRRYARACEVAPRGQHDGMLEQRVESVIDLIEPVATVTLPPLRPETQDDPERIADRYEPAIDHLLEIAAN